MLKTGLNKNLIFNILICLIMLLGIVLRLKLFLDVNAFEDDECRLANAILDVKNWQELLFPLLGGQTAPPIFLLVSKFVGNLSGYSEYAMKLIPFTAAIVSMFYFYKLCAQYFVRKISVLFSTFLFSFSLPLIYFAETFKQYSWDVLIAILCIYYFPKINIRELSAKQLTGFVLLIFVLPFISLSSLFYIAALFVQNIIKNLKDKEFYKRMLVILIPLFTALLYYYIFNLSPSQENINDAYPHYWDDGFCTLAIKDLCRIFIFNLKYYFAPNEFTLPALILFMTGIYYCCVDKTKTRNISYYLLYVMGFILLASLLHLYPWFARVGLHAISLIMLFVVKPLDCMNFKNWKFSVIIMFIFISFYKYNFAYFKEQYENAFISFSPKNLMILLKENFNPQTDIVLINDASAASYLFYASKFKFDNPEVFQMDIERMDNLQIDNYFKQLPNNKRYWFYLVKDFGRAEIYPYVLNWINSQKIVFEHQERKSYLYCVEKQEK